MFRSTTIAALCATALSGCGTDDQKLSSAEADVQRTVHEFLAAMAEGDGTTACAALTPTTQREVVMALGDGVFVASGPARTCEDVVAASPLATDPFKRSLVRQSRVRRVRIDGARATIADRDVYVAPEADTASSFNGRPLVLRRTEGSWKIEDFG